MSSTSFPIDNYLLGGKIEIGLVRVLNMPVKNSNTCHVPTYTVYRLQLIMVLANKFPYSRVGLIVIDFVRLLYLCQPEQSLFCQILK